MNAVEDEKKKRKSVICRHCGSKMDILTIKKHAGKWSYSLLAGGAFCFLFLGGPILGIPMVIGGIYMLTAEMTISYCPGCGHYFKVYLVDKESD